MRGFYSFIATVSFADTANGERSHDVIFLARHSREAALNVWEWVKWRRHHVPEAFGEVYCVKLYDLNPQPLVAGQYMPAKGSVLFEWKCDWGVTYEMQVESRLPRKSGARDDAA